ncbi:1247_t:CDS:1 [Cetraspora pellucida]|uniref:1247_t:CDS:1 n=1 Tax=Cetraspora pellucida TaxID=1433469 RepID=A0ACA9KGZ9_9GLOM|nr:1247_t:CDS:1 [Cetraspora pellucida]
MSLEENETFSFVEEQIELTPKSFSKKRNRVSFMACDKCRSMKKKCDGDYLSRKSCSSCAGREEECRYSDSHKRKAVETNDVQQFINRLEVIGDEIQKLTGELRKFYELSKNQDNLKVLGSEDDFNNDHNVSCSDNLKKKQPEAKRSHKSKSKIPGIKRNSKELKKEDSSSKKKDVAKGYFSKIYIPKGKYVTHQFDLKDFNGASSQFENTQPQPSPPSPVNNSELIATDNNDFSNNNTSNFPENLSYVFSPSEHMISNPIFLYNDLNGIL